MYNFGKFCCLCLSDERDLQSVENYDLNGVTIAKKIKVCVWKDVKFSENASEYICYKCLCQVRQSHDFYSTCAQKRREFNKCLRQLKRGKTKPDDCIDVTMADLKQYVTYDEPTLSGENVSYEDETEPTQQWVVENGTKQDTLILKKTNIVPIVVAARDLISKPVDYNKNGISPKISAKSVLMKPNQTPIDSSKTVIANPVNISPKIGQSPLKISAKSVLMKPNQTPVDSSKTVIANPVNISPKGTSSPFKISAKSVLMKPNETPVSTKSALSDLGAPFDSSKPIIANLVKVSPNRVPSAIKMSAKSVLMQPNQTPVSTKTANSPISTVNQFKSDGISVLGTPFDSSKRIIANLVKISPKMVPNSIKISAKSAPVSTKHVFTPIRAGKSILKKTIFDNNQNVIANAEAVKIAQPSFENAPNIRKFVKIAPKSTLPSLESNTNTNSNSNFAPVTPNSAPRSFETGVNTTNAICIPKLVQIAPMEQFSPDQIARTITYADIVKRRSFKSAPMSTNIERTSAPNTTNNTNTDQLPFKSAPTNIERFPDKSAFNNQTITKCDQLPVKSPPSTSTNMEQFPDKSAPNTNISPKRDQLPFKSAPNMERFPDKSAPNTNISPKRDQLPVKSAPNMERFPDKSAPNTNISPKRDQLPFKSAPNIEQFPDKSAFNKQTVSPNRDQFPFKSAQSNMERCPDKSAFNNENITPERNQRPFTSALSTNTTNMERFPDKSGFTNVTPKKNQRPFEIGDKSVSYYNDMEKFSDIYGPNPNIVKITCDSDVWGYKSDIISVASYTNIEQSPEKSASISSLVPMDLESSNNNIERSAAFNPNSHVAQITPSRATPSLESSPIVQKSQEFQRASTDVFDTVKHEFYRNGKYYLSNSRETGCTGAKITELRRSSRISVDVSYRNPGDSDEESVDDLASDWNWTPKSKKNRRLSVASKRRKSAIRRSVSTPKSAKCPIVQNPNLICVTPESTPGPRTPARTDSSNIFTKLKLNPNPPEFSPINATPPKHIRKQSHIDSESNITHITPNRTNPAIIDPTFKTPPQHTHKPKTSTPTVQTCSKTIQLPKKLPTIETPPIHTQKPQSPTPASKPKNDPTSSKPVQSPKTAPTDTQNPKSSTPAAQKDSKPTCSILKNVQIASKSVQSAKMHPTIETPPTYAPKPRWSTPAVHIDSQPSSSIPKIVQTYANYVQKTQSLKGALALSVDLDNKHKWVGLEIIEPKLNDGDTKSKNAQPGNSGCTPPKHKEIGDTEQPIKPLSPIKLLECLEYDQQCREWLYSCPIRNLDDSMSQLEEYIEIMPPEIPDNFILNVDETKCDKTSANSSNYVQSGPKNAQPSAITNQEISDRSAIDISVQNAIGCQNDSNITLVLPKTVQTPQKVVQTPQKLVQTPQKLVQTPQNRVQTRQKRVQTPEIVHERPRRIQTRSRTVESGEKACVSYFRAVNSARKGGPSKPKKIPERRNSIDKLCVQNFVENKEIINGEYSDYEYKCNICQISFPERPILKMHLWTHFEDDKNVRCPYCNKIFQRLLYLNRHLLKCAPAKNNESELSSD